MSPRHRRLQVEFLEKRDCPAVYIVDLADDIRDAADGRVSLREAVEASSATAEADEIQFDTQRVGGKILLSMGELEVRNSLSIVGPGADLLTIDVSASDPTPLWKQTDGARIINAPFTPNAPNPTIELRGLTLSGGDAGGDGGCILSSTPIVIEDAIIEDCRGSNGGAIYAWNITLRRTVLRNNLAGIEGGAVFAFGELRAYDTWFYSNWAGSNGGAIQIRGQRLEIYNSTISDNGTMGDGGADGGGIAIRATTAEIVNSTIFRNSIQGIGEGGAIHGRATNVAIRHSTIASNTTSWFSDVSGVYLENDSQLLVENSIIADNDGSGRELAADNLTVRNSLVGNNQGSGLLASFPEPDANGNLIGSSLSPLDPSLGPMIYFGGNTPTLPLRDGSPAINAGAVDFLAPPLTDQRGAPRVLLGRLDMGAFEFAGPGDLTNDGRVDAQDIDFLCQSIRQGADGGVGDLNHDGVLDALDFEKLMEGMDTMVGDANLDGTFNSGDLVAIFQRGHYEDEIVGNSGWADGDWNCDGEFTTGDLVAAFQAGAYTAAASALDSIGRSNRHYRLVRK